MSKGIFLTERGVYCPLIERYKDVGRVRLSEKESREDDIQATEFDENGKAEFIITIKRYHVVVDLSGVGEMASTFPQFATI